MEVGETYAKVITIVDPRSSISIMLERSRDEGILKGAQDARGQQATMRAGVSAL